LIVRTTTEDATVESPWVVGFGIAESIATILTALVAVIGYGLYLWDKRAKRVRLEEYLRKLKEKPDGSTDKGQRTVLHLVARVGMTEADVVDATFRSKHLKRKVGIGADGNANVLYVEYVADVTAE
jgi:hypothetical protein